MERSNIDCSIQIEETSNRKETRKDMIWSMLWKNPFCEIFQSIWRKCYIRKDEENLGKFDTRADEGIFLGYSTKSKPYKCYNKRLRGIVESTNVNVDEDILKNTEIEVVYESNESTSKEEEEKAIENVGQNDEEIAPATAPKTPRYVQRNHSNN